MASVASTASSHYGSTGTPSRRATNQSVSSTNSTSSRSDRGTQPSAQPAVESAVTRLLVAIKQLLESLNLWSTGKATEDQVSDVYVRLGNGFNEAVAAFSMFNIDMSELMSVPDDLRHVLEQCLAEEATPENLDLYLPTVRQIITNLLQGLRGKQSVYRRIMSEHRHKSSEQSSGGGSDRESRPKLSRGHRSQLSKSSGDADRLSEKNSVSRRGAVSSTSKKKESLSQAAPPPSMPSDDEPFVGGFAIIRENNATPTHNSDLPSSRRRGISPAAPSLPPQDYFSPTRPTFASEDDSASDQVPPLPSSTPSQVPASVKRYSLVDAPLPPSPPAPPAATLESSAPGIDNHDQNINGHGNANIDAPTPPGTPPMDALQVPAMANSLAALKRSETLERRASKRFSSYNISKMTGGPSTRDRPHRGNHSNRRSVAANATLTAGELAVLTEEGEEPPESPPVRKKSLAGGNRPITSLAEEPEPPIPPIQPPVDPVSDSVPAPALPAPNGVVKSSPPAAQPTESSSVKGANDPPSGGSRRSFPVFLQLGREVKKVTIEPGLSFSSLRILFVDKFSYNPGLEDFPAVYIRDPSSGVQYELENMDEVKENCLLSLNIEPLDQIKQHIDTQISVLSRDIKELRTTLSNNQQSLYKPTIITNPLAESSPAPNRPTDRQLRSVARRLSRLVGDDTTMSNPPSQLAIPRTQTPDQTIQTQLTGNSVISEYSSRVVSDLKTQFDEVQNLRRDLGIMRQLYTEFMKSTKDSLGTLRNQTQSVKQLANNTVGGARAYIDSGKKQLDTRSQTVLTKVEELQDMVEGIKDDVLRRHVTPKPQLVKKIKQDIDSLAVELESLKEHLKTIQPMWKKTWAEELQNVVEEQQFLKHQEDFLNDLLEDHAAVVEVYGHVEKVISIRSTGSGRAALRTRGFKPAPPDEGHTGLSTVMLEIRGAAVDPEKRMKAIAANQKSREKELESRSNELQTELTDFVGGKKLKMTGGAEEAERVRQRRNELTMKAMFNSGGDDETG